MKSVALGTAIIVGLVLGLAGQGQAANLTVSLSNGGAPVVCADGAGCDLNPVAGKVTLITTFGTLTLSLGATGSGAPATAGPFDMDLSYDLTQPAGTPATTYTILVSENGLNWTLSGFTASIGGTEQPSGLGGTTTAFAAFADPSNTLFGTGAPLCSAGPTGVSPVSLACSSTSFSAANFSLTEKITIVTPAGAAQASGDALLVGTVPEPTTLLLLGSGLVGVVLFGLAGAHKRSA